MSNFKYLFVGSVFLHLLSLFFDNDTGSYQCAIMPEIVTALGAAGGSLLNSIVGNDIGKSNARYQVKLQKDLMNYQWTNFNSPAAQAKALAQAGMNPSVVFGQGSNFASPSAAAPAISPVDVGLSGADLSQAILALSQAKKAGIDTSLGEEDIKLKQIQQDRDNFELELRKKFGLQQSAADLALAKENLHLAKLSGDKTEIEKAIMQYTKAKEKALSECEETRRGILEKELQNTDKRLKLENRVLSTQGDANIASANASNSQADINKEVKKLRSIEREVAESGKTDKIKEYLSELKRNKMLNDKEFEELRTKYLSLKNRNDYGDKNQWYRDFYNILDDVETYLYKLNPLKGVFNTK